MTEKEKSVSVVMCTYNGEKYIEEQLDSIIGQSYAVDEIIIQDDCSTDKTLDIVKRYQQKHNNIHLFVNEQNLGFNANFISAIQKASGSYIALSDQDDIWDPNKIKVQIEAMNDGLVSFHTTKPFSADGTKIKENAGHKTPNFCLERLIYGNVVSGHTVMMKRSFIQLIPHLSDFSSYYKYWYYDHILAIVAESHGGLVYINQALTAHRRLASSASYSTPQDYSHTVLNAVRYLQSAISTYRDKSSVMKDYFSRMHHFLSALPKNRTKTAMLLCSLQMKRTLFNYLRLTLKCIQFRNTITAPFKAKGFFNFCKAAFFPFYCSEYFKDKQM